MKLHLGCGEQHFEGYVNIDYPSSEHSVQLTSGADEFANLLELKYKAGTIDEVRLHHVFEHFQRATACALLASWNSWLKIGGILRIEVPDFERTAKVALGRFNSKQKKTIALRHIFGSQEAHWAVHYHGYTPLILCDLMEKYGFKVKEVKRKNSRGILHNIDITTVKVASKSKKEAESIAFEYLKEYMAADVDSERLMVQTWLKEYTQQVEKTFATE